MGKTRISRREFYSAGGLANPNLFRKAIKNAAWSYWRKA